MNKKQNSRYFMKIRYDAGYILLIIIYSLIIGIHYVYTRSQTIFWAEAIWFMFASITYYFMILRIRKINRAIAYYFLLLLITFIPLEMISFIGGARILVIILQNSISTNIIILIGFINIIGFTYLTKNLSNEFNHVLESTEGISANIHKGFLNLSNPIIWEKITQTKKMSPIINWTRRLLPIFTAFTIWSARNLSNDVMLVTWSGAFLIISSLLVFNISSIIGLTIQLIKWETKINKKIIIT